MSQFFQQVCADRAEAKKNATEFFFPWHFDMFTSQGKELPCPCSLIKRAYGQTLSACHHQFVLEILASITAINLSNIG